MGFFIDGLDLLVPVACTSSYMLCMSCPMNNWTATFGMRDGLLGGAPSWWLSCIPGFGEVAPDLAKGDCVTHYDGTELVHTTQLKEGIRTSSSV